MALATDLYSAADVANVGAAFQAVQMNLVRPLPGDFNNDGVVSVADIQVMMSALANESNFEIGRGFTSDDQMRILGNLNGDNVFNNADIQALISLVANIPGGSNSPIPVPEPDAWMLMFASALGMLGVRRGARG